jgi:hypothetical protein
MGTCACTAGAWRRSVFDNTFFLGRRIGNTIRTIWRWPDNWQKNAKSYWKPGVVSYRIVSYRIVSYRIVSYRIVSSYRVLSKLAQVKHQLERIFKLVPAGDGGWTSAGDPFTVKVRRAG